MIRPATRTAGSGESSKRDDPDTGSGIEAIILPTRLMDAPTTLPGLAPKRLPAEERVEGRLRGDAQAYHVAFFDLTLLDAEK